MKPPMPNRRHVLAGAAATLGAGAALAAKPPLASELLGGRLGVQLYTFRKTMERDVPGALALVKKLGFKLVESGGLKDMSAADAAKLLAKNGLACESLYARWVRLESELPKVLEDARALGVKHVVSGSIPHEGRFSRDACLRAADAFGKWSKAVTDAGFGFAYHIHGYEFEPSADGTLFDTLAKSTPPDRVHFEADVFWIARGGCNPAALIARYPGRFPLLHLKDIAKGSDICRPDGTAPDEASVPLGDGMIDWPAVLAAARAGGAKAYFLEDEHPNAEAQVPRSLAYLKSLEAR